MDDTGTVHFSHYVSECYSTELALADYLQEKSCKNDIHKEEIVQKRYNL